MREINRREFLTITTIAALSFITGCKPSENSPLLDSPEKILEKIKELNFQKGSEIRTTIFPRKIMWEISKTQGNDTSDWISNLDVMKDSLKTLKDAGVKGARLSIVPFELTQDGENFDWTPLETALNLMQENNLACDLCLGPLDYPYGPGVRLPKKFEDMARKQPQIIVDTTGPYHDWAIDFLQKTLQKYGKDPRIDKFYLGNEWPDAHGIENVDNTTMSITSNFMQEAIELILKLTDKKVVLNTNIHVSKIDQIKNTFGPIFKKLGDRGVLGIDAYPTQEYKDTNLASKIPDYGKYVQNLRKTFPNIIFTELQGEPWNDRVSGKSWAEAEKTHANDVMVPYYEQTFPPTLESYVIASGITEVNIWGAPAWLVTTKEGFKFPLDMIKTIVETMKKST